MSTYLVIRPYLCSMFQWTRFQEAEDISVIWAVPIEISQAKDRFLSEKFPNCTSETTKSRPFKTQEKYFCEKKRTILYSFWRARTFRLRNESNNVQSNKRPLLRIFQAEICTLQSKTKASCWENKWKISNSFEKMVHSEDAQRYIGMYVCMYVCM
jgi:hypothetical protein